MQVFQVLLKTRPSSSPSSSSSSRSPSLSLTVQTAALAAFVCMCLATTVVSSMPLPVNSNRSRQRRRDGDSALTASSAASQSTSTLTEQLPAAFADVRKREATVTRYEIDPRRSQRSTAVMASSKDVNLMILPLSSIIVFTVLFAIRISRWCVEDVRDADDSATTHRIHRMNDMAMVLSRPADRSWPMYEHCFEPGNPRANSKPSPKLISSGNGLKINGTLRGSTPADLKQVAAQSPRSGRSNRSAASGGIRRHHDSSRAAKIRAHTADGRRRDGMSTTSIPLAELLSTTALPLMHEGRDLLLSANDNQRLKQAGTADDIVERCRRAGGHVIVFPVSSTASSTSHRARKRNNSSPASSASTSLNGSTATTSSWCSDTRPLVRLDTSRSTSTSTTADDRLIASSNSTIDISAADLMTSSTPQLVRGSSGRSDGTNHAAGGRSAAARATATASNRSRYFAAKHLQDRRCRQPPQTAPPVFVSRLVQDSLNLSLRFFHIPLDGVESSSSSAAAAAVASSSDNLLRNSSESVFICSISAENGNACSASPPDSQTMRSSNAAETAVVDFGDSACNRMSADCDRETTSSDVVETRSLCDSIAAKSACAASLPVAATPEVELPSSAVLATERAVGLSRIIMLTYQSLETHMLR